MKNIGTLRRWLVAGAVAIGAAAGAQAQDVDPKAMVEGGLQAVQMIDQNKVGELWDGAAPAARARVKRAEFIDQVAQVRTTLGAPQQRAWVAINRQVLTDPDPDLAGQYVSVEYETRFSNAVNRNVREMTSFHLDRDGIWRFSGYVLR